MRRIRILLGLACCVLWGCSGGLSRNPGSGSSAGASATGSSGATGLTSASTGATGGTGSGTTSGGTSSSGSAGTSSATSSGSGSTTGSNLATASTLADDGNPNGTVVGVAQLYDGRIIASDPPNEVLLDASANPLVVFSGSGLPQSSGTTLENASFDGPLGMASFGALLYVADSEAHVIRAIDVSGDTVSIFAGQPGAPGVSDGRSDLANFDFPEGLVVGATGTVYVADTYNCRIRTIASGQVATLAGSSCGLQNGTGTGAKFNLPRAVALGPNGVVYVADTENKLVRVVDADGTVATVVALDGRPFGIASDGQGTTYVGDFDHDAVYRIDGGQLTLVYQGDPLSHPRQMAFDAQGRLLVASTGNAKVVALTLP